MGGGALGVARVGYCAITLTINGRRPGGVEFYTASMKLVGGKKVCPTT